MSDYGAVFRRPNPFAGHPIAARHRRGPARLSDIEVGGFFLLNDTVCLKIERARNAFFDFDENTVVRANANPDVVLLELAMRVATDEETP